LLTCTLVQLSQRAEAKDVKIKLGTLAPEGSPWHNSIKRMGQKIKEISGGRVNLVIYAGGVAGDEGDMVRKMRIGQLSAATITNIGLGRISRASLALQIPMTIESYEELDYVRTKIGAKIAAEMEKEGYVVLNWGDAGWVHFFSKEKGTLPDDFRKMKMFVWSGDPEAERAWKAAKFTTVALSSTDVLASLQSGLIESFGTSPLYALTAQWFTPAKHMLQLNWTPLNGATVITKKQWEKIDAKFHPELLKIAKEEGDALIGEIRAMSDNATEEMVKRGLNVTQPDSATVDAWRKTAEVAYPDIRGKVVPEKYFDEVQRLVKEKRK
jgi:TRAP-type C4-dicarboxylate transport system substrate-binding protein